jgi:hypothetical protein
MAASAGFLQNPALTPMKNPFSPAILAAAAIAFSGASRAAEHSEGQTFLSPAEAGQDYRDQGEYKNDWGGAQVIALGNDEFRMVTYPGGLPGDGWEKQGKTENKGRREGDKVVFNGANGYQAELTGGKITIRSQDGGPWTMEKVERRSPTLGAKPPEEAVVLFDGSNADAWVNGHLDDQHRIASGAKSKQSFTNFTAHLEFYLPFKPLGRGQERGNSGVYLQDRYEVQVLDSFGLKGENNECGAIYSQAAPEVNMCYPPLTWQTYDIDFTAAQFDASGAKEKDAIVSIKQNGVPIFENHHLKGPTPGGKKESASGGPLQLQGHGNPVFYRNIWVVPKS